VTFPRQTTPTVINLGARRRHANPPRTLAERFLRQRPDPDPVDVPLMESRRIAAGIPATPLTSVVDRGKGLTPEPNTDWETWIAPVLALCRPRGRQCRCGNAGVLRLGDERYCQACRPRGLAVVDPDGAA
jgi:hypothetical protein